MILPGNEYAPGGVPQGIREREQANPALKARSEGVILTGVHHWEKA